MFLSLYVYVYGRCMLIHVQVEILQLRNALEAAQARLGEMRKISYRED